MACRRDNPLLREGTAQAGRGLAALDPASAPLDARTPADLLLFARRFAAHLRYVDAGDVDDGAGAARDWVPFWSADPAVAVARLADLGTGTARSLANDLRAILAEGAKASNEMLLGHLAAVFAVPVALYREARAAAEALPEGHPLAARVGAELARASASLSDMAAYYRGAEKSFEDAPVSFPPPAFTVADLELTVPARAREWFGTRPLASLLAAWAAGTPGASPDARPFAESGDTFGRISDALGYNLLALAFEGVFAAAGRIGVAAEGYLGTNPADTPDHAPHYALWLAFLRLLRRRQDRLNALTGRHLDYYYREVLRLRPRSAEPDAAHVLFTLKRGVDTLRLPAGTAFRAGKDSAGTLVRYALGEETPVNRSAVAAVRSVYASRGELYARAEALVGDGPWAGGQRARVGFAVSAPQLDVRGGTRVVTLTFGRPVRTVPLLRAYVTAVEGWVPIRSVSVKPVAAAQVQLPADKGASYLWLHARQASMAATASASIPKSERSGADNAITETGAGTVVDAIIGSGSAQVFELTDWVGGLTFNFTPADPEIAGFAAGVHVDADHPDAFDTDAPVLKVVLDSRAGDWTAIEVGRVALSAEVKGSRALSVRNADGPVGEVGEAFPLFGVRPGAKPWMAFAANGAAFAERLASLSLRWSWEEALTPNGDHAYELGDTRDTPKGEATLRRMSAREVGKSLTLSLSASPTAVATVEATPKDVPTVRRTPGTSGEMRLTLQHSLGHDTYQARYARAVMARALATATTELTVPQEPSGQSVRVESQLTPGSADLPREPFPARVTDLALDFTTAPAAPRLFRLYPFGFRAHPPGDDPADRLLPRLPRYGALYVGIAEYTPPARLALLVEVAPGSADPRAAVAELTWSYLAGDAWVASGDLLFRDGTDGLRRTGIAELDVPAAADTRHRRLPDGLHWLRLEARGPLGGVHRVRSIRAQAGTVHYVADAANDPAFLAVPLPAGTIAKPVAPVVGLKGVEQPAPSFGGRGPETDPAFRLRASERLRHRDRAVQIWDYERLVLARFPEISRVKCLNHTDGVDGQRPGHVEVVCLPHVDAGAADPLRPFLREDTRRAVGAFLRARTSPFVRLRVVQPYLEHLRVTAAVRFRDQGNPRAQLARLGADLTAHLTPWATAGGGAVAFGGRWPRSAIVDFLDERPYVDYVTDVALEHVTDVGSTAEETRVVTTAAASRPGAVLVAAGAHVLTSLAGKTPAP